MQSPAAPVAASMGRPTRRTQRAARWPPPLSIEVFSSPFLSARASGLSVGIGRRLHAGAGNAQATFAAAAIDARAGPPVVARFAFAFRGFGLRSRRALPDRLACVAVGPPHPSPPLQSVRDLGAAART